MRTIIGCGWEKYKSLNVNREEYKRDIYRKVRYTASFQLDVEVIFDKSPASTKT